MTGYVAEVFVPGVTEAIAHRIAEGLQRGAVRLAAEGVAVRFLGVTLLVEDQALLCRWESGTEQAVRAVHELSGVGPVRMVRSVDFAVSVDGGPPTLRGAERAGQDPP